MAERRFQSDSLSLPSSNSSELRGRKTGVFIALGSNVGDRIANIENAMSEMRQKGLKIMKTSSLYETKAMYYENQGDFLNGVCEIETSLEPLDLLDVLQSIEARLGRIKVIEKGPRNIDLDILLYGSTRLDHERLHVPHKLMLEREFVLRPLADISTDQDLTPGSSPKLTPADAMTKLPSATDSPHTVSVLAPDVPFIRATDPARHSHVMAILNITPDSFSDGGLHGNMSTKEIGENARKFIAEGATILDIGGQSTRPKAALLTAEEELSRILPVIRHIRTLPEANKVVISVDTFYSKVAREASMAGADVINDVSGGTMDHEMLSTVADLGKTIVLMHMRGTPETMTGLTRYPGGVVKDVAFELRQRVEAAEAAGIPRWRVILDPGIGFAKHQAQNLELLRGLNELRAFPAFKGLPWLVGASRKGFIGKITGVSNARERVWGTAAAVTASVAGGADIVRVHDVSEMAQVVKMADAIYRTNPIAVP